MTQNLVSLQFTTADLAALDATLDALEDRLKPLIGLTPEQRQSLTKMGSKSEAFCRQTLALLQQNPDILPKNFDLAEAQSDLANIDALRPRFMRLRKLAERADDSELALGSDVMVAALGGYAQLKLSGRAQGLEGLRELVSSRFLHGPKSVPAAAPAVPAAPTSVSAPPASQP